MRIWRISLVILCAVLACAAPSLAQQQDENTGGGVEAGYDLSYLTVRDGSQRTLGSGLLVGAYADLPVKALTLQFGAQYIERGSGLTVGSGIAQRTFDQRARYIAVPVLIRMPLWWGLHIMEGPSFDFVISGKRTFSTGTEQDVKAQLTKPDIGLVIAVGGQRGVVDWDVRWNESLRGFYQSLPVGETQKRSRAISFVFGYHFRKNP
jgi:hypothetical protein